MIQSSVTSCVRRPVYPVTRQKATRGLNLRNSLYRLAVHDKGVQSLSAAHRTHDDQNKTREHQIGSPLSRRELHPLPSLSPGAEDLQSRNSLRDAPHIREDVSVGLHADRLHTLTLPSLSEGNNHHRLSLIRTSNI